MTFSICSGQTIGIMSPSSAIVRERFDAGCAVLRDRGFQLAIHPQTYAGADSGNQLSSPPDLKAHAFTELWEDKSVDAIMASTGGNSASQFLHLLDFKKLKENSKPVMGFSDTTSLLSFLYKNDIASAIFAPTVQTIGRIDNLDMIFDVLSGQPNQTINLTGAKVIKDGSSVDAPIFAVTLSVFMSLIGTPYFPDLKGHILFIEDIGEELSHLDRMLWQLNEVCPFSALAGLVFGEFVDLKDTGRPFGLNFEEIIQKYANELSLPVLINAPIGHGSHIFPVHLGRKASLNATKQTLILL